MLSFATPWVIGAAMAAAALVGVLHLLSVRRPTALLLPTTRFVPGGEARAVARQPRPNDLLLLALRVAALLCAGMALAGVRWTSTQHATVRLVVAEPRQQRDSARWMTSPMADRVDFVWQDHLVDDPGIALVAATRAAAARAQREAGIERFALTVVLPPSARSLQGWDAWRSSWPGPVDVQSSDTLRTPRETWAPPPVFVQSGGRPDDVVAAAFADAPPATVDDPAQQHVVRIDRGRDVDTVSPSPSVMTNVVVHWPQDGRPDGWEARTPPDTVGALVAMGQALVGPWMRTARVPEAWRADSRLVPVAWWSDGEVAAVERAVEDGCVRDVAIAVPDGSDLLRSASAAGVRRALTAPCGGPTVSTGRLTADRARLADTVLAPASAFRVEARAARGTEPWWLGPVLLGVAMLLLVAEWIVRRGEASA